MRERLLKAVVLAASVAVFPSTALAAPERAVCPGPAAAGFARCHAHVVTFPDGTPRSSSGPTGYGSAQFHGAYQLPTSTSAAASQTIAIVDAYDDPSIQSDLNYYDSAFNLPKCDNTSATDYCFEKLNQNGVQGAYPSGNSGWALEIALDVETAHEICQNCKIRLVEASSSSLANLETAETTAAKLGATEISNSWGGGEYSSETSADQYFSHSGVVTTVASGDNGYGSFGYPAASPYVVAAGGTTLNLVSNGNGTYSYGSERAWSGSGSGCSAYEPAPPFQTGLSACGSRREVADVAADADPNTGAAVYDSVRYLGRSGWFQVGGTSLSSPLIAAVFALEGGASSTTPAPGDVYGAWGANPSQLHDVTQGSTGSCGGASTCTAVPGYDGPTGLGTPNGPSAF